MKIKKLTKAIIKKNDFKLNHAMDHDDLDHEYALSWHPSIGMLVGEWMNVMTTYAVERDRKLFFATNDWGMPTCFFDASNPKELHKLLDNEREINRTQFMNPKKRKIN